MENINFSSKLEEHGHLLNYPFYFFYILLKKEKEKEVTKKQ